MTTLIVVAVVVAVGVIVGMLAQQRRPPVETTRSYDPPMQLHRSDFAGTDRPWLVVIFSSATCSSCAEVVSKALVLSSDEVEVQEVEVGAAGDLHRRYGIEGVPMTVIADHQGAVRRAFVGPVTATDLWAAMAELRSG